ncbi:hypothetical protein Agub_g5453, partial [Astrephomene gubernaculifera]
MMLRSRAPKLSGSRLGLLLAILAWRCSADLIINPMPLSEFVNGTSIFWGGPQDGQDDPFEMRLPPGACGYGEMDSKMWPFYLVTGISASSPLVQQRPLASCGTCLEVKCVSTDPKVCVGTGTVTVVVTDECPSCAPYELNMHAFAFEQIARLEYGKTAIQYRQVECSPADNITVRVDSFRVVQGGWIRLSIKGVASDAGIVSVELARSLTAAVGSNSTVGAADATQTAAQAASGADASGRVWKPMENTYGAEWELSALPSPPYDLRITDKFGRKLVLTGVIAKAGQTGEFPGGGQFPALTAATVSAYKSSLPIEVPVAANSTASLPTRPPTSPPANATKLAATTKPTVTAATAAPATVSAATTKPAAATTTAATPAVTPKPAVTAAATPKPATTAAPTP